MTNRKDTLQWVRENPDVSVLIIGAGINGIGVYRELAMQNIDVLLVDQADFCAGASAASSHMAHGGLRYLENAEFRLVREALRERNLLLQNAPHYVKPLPTTIPIFRWFSGLLNAPLKFLRLRDKPSERGAIVIKLGLLFYDIFTLGQQGVPRHRFFSRARSLKSRPQLNPNIVCTARYYDAWMPSPERICVELVLDTEELCPQAKSLNYVSAIDAEKETVYLQDEFTGERLPVRPKIVINAAGPWIDFANQKLRRKTHYIGGTKGSHLVLDHPELHAVTQGNEMFFENKDGRICLFFPLEDRVLLGTTDIRVDNPDDAFCTEEEIDYMLELVNHVFPSIKVDRSHIVFQFCGVRPLPSSESSRTGQISRDHSIEILPPSQDIHFPIYSLVGGKWTTFRAFAEQTTHKLLERLSKPRLVQTDRMPIGGGKQYPKSEVSQRQWLLKISKKTGLAQERLEVLFKRYGTYAEDIAEFVVDGDDRSLHHRSDYSYREILFIAQHEKVMHLDDFILRRSLLGMLGYVTHNRPLVEEIATVVGDALGWSQAQIQQEVERTIEIFKKRHQATI